MEKNGRGIPDTSHSFPADTDLLIVMLGTNDLLQWQSPERATERLERFLAAIPLDRRKILLIAPPPVHSGPDVSIYDFHSFARLCLIVAKRLGIRLADTGKWDIALTDDGVHFTEQGHKAFAVKLLEELK